MATFRQRALNEAATHQTGRFFVEEGVAEGAYLYVENLMQRLRRIDMQGHRPAEQAECRDHANQPEAVVAMDMRDEDSLEP